MLPMNLIFTINSQILSLKILLHIRMTNYLNSEKHSRVASVPSFKTFRKKLNELTVDNNIADNRYNIHHILIWLWFTLAH